MERVFSVDDDTRKYVFSLSLSLFLSRFRSKLADIFTFFTSNNVAWPAKRMKLCNSYINNKYPLTYYAEE